MMITMAFIVLDLQAVLSIINSFVGPCHPCALSLLYLSVLPWGDLQGLLLQSPSLLLINHTPLSCSLQTITSNPISAHFLPLAHASMLAPESRGVSKAPKSWVTCRQCTTPTALLSSAKRNIWTHYRHDVGHWDCWFQWTLRGKKLAMMFSSFLTDRTI